MKIDATTPEEELERLYTAVTQREMLRGTPLNLGPFLRYTLLFLLFPGMLLGFWAGLLITMIFCSGLMVCLAMGHREFAVAAAQWWLVCGFCIVLWITWSTVNAARKTMKERRTPREAKTREEERFAQAEHEPLNWKRCTGMPLWETQMRLQTHAAGIAALMVELKDGEKGKLLTPERRGTCCVFTETQAGQMRCLLLYKLEAGVHELRLLFAGERPPRNSFVHTLRLPRG